MKALLPVLGAGQEVESTQKRLHKESFREILDRLTPHQKKYVDENAREARGKKSLEKLFLALDANNIEVLYREHELAIRFTRTLEEDGYLTPEQAEEVYGLVECTLLDWLKNANDCSSSFLTDIRAVIARTNSDNDLDAEWNFLEVEFYLRLGLVRQDALDEALLLVLESGDQAKRAKATDKVALFQILADMLASWGARSSEVPKSPQPAKRKWFTGKFRSYSHDVVWFRNIINEQRKRNSQNGQFL